MIAKIMLLLNIRSVAFTESCEPNKIVLNWISVRLCLFFIRVAQFLKSYPCEMPKSYWYDNAKSVNFKIKNFSPQHFCLKTLYASPQIHFKLRVSKFLPWTLIFNKNSLQWLECMIYAPKCQREQKNMCAMSAPIEIKICINISE
jgi:hypothetical protein